MTRYRIGLLPIGGYPRAYVSVWTMAPAMSLADVLKTAQQSGLSPWTGPAAEAAGYGPTGRHGRIWIEEDGKPATVPELKTLWPARAGTVTKIGEVFSLPYRCGHQSRHTLPIPATNADRATLQRIAESVASQDCLTCEQPEKKR